MHSSPQLLTPGPTPVPTQVARVMAAPLIHHRKATFEKVMGEVRQGLQWLFQTKQEVLMVTSSGTGAMEGAVVNTLSPGDPVLVVNGGKFGERWGQICRAYALEVDEIKVTWGEAVDPKAIAEKLKAKRYKAVLFQASETSTGAYHPVQEIAAVVDKYPDTLCIVDGISAVGAIDIPFDAWKIDVLVSGSQKGFMLPPGLAFAALSDKAWQASQKSRCPKFYFNFAAEKKAALKNQNAYTPAITLVLGLAESLRMMRAEGLQNMFQRHARLAEATRAAVRAMGLKIFAKVPANSVTAVVVPEGISGAELVKNMEVQKGIVIAGGQDHLKGKIFRMGHLGWAQAESQLKGIQALEEVLADLKYSFKRGSAVAAAKKVLGV